MTEREIIERLERQGRDTNDPLCTGWPCDAIQFAARWISCLQREIERYREQDRRRARFEEET